MTTAYSLFKQRGVILLESLIGILIFSIGALALVAMYANSFTVAADAQYRMEANHYANQLLNEMWIRGNRSNEAALTASLLSFAYNADPNGNCEAGFAGGGGNAVVDAWVAQITAPNTGLPDASASTMQVLFDGALGNQVTITVCWKAPSDKARRKHVLVGNVN